MSLLRAHGSRKLFRQTVRRIPANTTRRAQRLRRKLALIRRLKPAATGPDTGPKRYLKGSCCLFEAASRETADEFMLNAESKKALENKGIFSMKSLSGPLFASISKKAPAAFLLRTVCDYIDKMNEPATPGKV